MKVIETIALYEVQKAKLLHQWLTSIILATQEASIRRTEVQSHLGQIVCETLSQKYPTQNKPKGVAQVVGCLPN
jgi:hypothetical protein